MFDTIGTMTHHYFKSEIKPKDVCTFIKDGKNMIVCIVFNVCLHYKRKKEEGLSVKPKNI